MVKKQDSYRDEIRENLKEGNGNIVFTHIFEEGELFGKARTFAIMTLAPGTSIGKHAHNPEAEAYLVLEGEIEADDNGETVVLSVGDSMLTGEGKYHAIVNKTEKDAKVLAVIMK